MMKRDTYNIVKVARLLSLVVLMAFGAGLKGWGQTIDPTYPKDLTQMGQSVETIYANQGDLTINFQEGNVASSVDGYIRWYVEDGGNGNVLGLKNNNSVFKYFSNGYVWVNSGDDTPNSSNTITYTYSGTDEVTVVCEASSIYNTIPQSGDYVSPLVSVQRKYIIKPAKDRAEDLNSKRQLLLEEIGNDWWSNSESFKKLINSTSRNKYYLDDYEIHVPLGRKVTFRLSENLSNYFVPVVGWNTYVAATTVRWNVFKEDGSRDNYGVYSDVYNDYKWTTEINATQGIWYNVGLNNNDTQTQVFYLVAEILYNGVSYPASFIKLYVEPNAQPLTETLLTENYPFRTESYLEEEGYKTIGVLDFDEDVQSEITASNNFSNAPMANADSYYAYAYPVDFKNRKNRRLSVGRGEYGLYRSLNLSSVSKGSVTINKESGIYNDYFAGDGGYNKTVLDRKYITSNKQESGYFLYVDAADEPGVITKIKMDDHLCNDIRLIVTAWVCDMSSSNDPNKLVFADIGLTFKGVDMNGKETILNKYYSGEIGRPDQDVDSEAQWQQLYFTFNYPGGEDYDYFILEIANNSSSSIGADYAIDDIRVYRSTPNIEVIREDACDASTLTISSDYETLLANMDWIAGQDIPDLEAVSENPELIKYRFGLQGDASNETSYPELEKTFGNTYFSFLEGLAENENGNLVVDDKEDVTATNHVGKLGTNEYRWIRINNTISGPVQSVYSLRVVVSTDKNKLPTNYDDAQHLERILNFRALKDYNYAVDHWENMWSNPENRPEWLGDNIDVPANIDEDNINDNIDIYASLMQNLYSKLEIPRIRVPWIQDNTLYLSRVNVSSTDLRYVGEILGYDEYGKSITAAGQYQVILFDAIQIQNGVVSEAGFLNNDCNLISSFFVRRPVRITVETDPDVEGMICAGTQRQITAELINVETGDPLDESYYGFDWFLGTEESYNYLTSTKTFGDGVTLKLAIETYRRENQDTDNITEQEVRGWQTTSYTDIKNGLLSVFNSLRTNMTNYTIILDTDTIIAMPFIKRDFDDALYCTEITPVPFDAMSDDVPEIHPGLSSVSYPAELTDTPVRLGLRHIRNTAEVFRIPLRKDIVYSVENDDNGPVDNSGHVLRELSDNKSIFLEDIKGEFPIIAEVDELYAIQGGTDNYVTFKFTKDAADKLKTEGEEYVLRIPFGEYESESATTSLGATCDGLAELHVKIVPEYLTWQNEGMNWYNESSEAGAWKQSNEKELYMGNLSENQDVNGDDEVNVFTYSPLYFTKITVLDGEELQLVQPTYQIDNKTLDITADNIQYDMAVDTVKPIKEGDKGSITIVPYYINKVDQIYFKPEATLMNQHHLDYQKAWVDFEMEAGKPYWMSSPLKGVYAGDMYAPSSNGRQETAAFTDIYYNGIHEDGTDLNSRWNPAFYQKAWDKAITYSNSEDGTSTTSINAVKSNWSIEYNDVTVPYSLGKGFYSKVEKEDEGNVLVRLPKADTEYKYETKTRALTNTGKLPGDYGKLADESEISIDLSGDTETTQEEVDGDGTHFLVGNPYMTYLNMSEFFNENAKEDNPVLVKKYWLLENGASKAIVGAPDVEWENNETEKDPISGFIPPMTAFFVELSDNAGDDKTIKFTTDMMAAKPTPTDNVYTKSYSASNPILTLTAERGETRSVARLLTSDKGHDEYEASEDAVLLLDSELDAPMVYTVAGDVAAQFNTMQSIRNVPLGVYAAKGEEVELTIRGISQFADKLYLYDAVTRQSTPLDDDSYTFRVTGPSHGRFTLTSQNRISAESDICVYSPIAGQLLVMSSPEEALQRVQVYDMSGRMVVSRDNIRNTTCQLSLASGIYIVYAENESGNVRVKIRIR